ncbi:MAG TPA: translation elongation factor Ts [Burkholderiales bacterium]|nr:translation elongation factor Ts [Burkholderiales bacterium]
MAEISASLVKELRELTGLGMMECKKALAEAGGDLKKAEELLRIKSGAKASKAAGRVAAEGVIGAWLSPDARLGALVELNCETDFVAKNEDFLAFARELAETVAKTDPADVAALAAFEDRRKALVQKIGENISIRRFARLQARGKLALYLHGAKIGVLVDLEGPDDLGKDLAMHVAAFKPKFAARSEVPVDEVARERDIATARAKESGKPPEIVAKMVEGAVNKVLNEMTLLGQPFVKDDKQTVEKLLAAKKAKLHAYRLLVVGEGIERKSSDFAAEVMATAGAAR